MEQQISSQELMDEIVKLKVLAIKNAKPLFDEKITQCVAAIIVDLADGIILYSTIPVNEMFGYPAGGLDGKNIVELMPERFRQVHEGHLRRFAENPKSRQMGEASMALFGLSQDGNEFKIEISLYPTEIINKKAAVATVLKTRN